MENKPILVLIMSILCMRNVYAMDRPRVPMPAVFFENQARARYKRMIPFFVQKNVIEANHAEQINESFENDSLDDVEQRHGALMQQVSDILRAENNNRDAQEELHDFLRDQDRQP